MGANRLAFRARKGADRRCGCHRPVRKARTSLVEDVLDTGIFGFCQRLWTVRRLIRGWKGFLARTVRTFGVSLSNRSGRVCARSAPKVTRSRCSGTAKGERSTGAPIATASSRSSGCARAACGGQTVFFQIPGQWRSALAHTAALTVVPASVEAIQVKVEVRAGSSGRPQPGSHCARGTVEISEVRRPPGHDHAPVDRGRKQIQS